MTAPGREHSSEEELALAREEIVGADHLLALGLGRIALTRAYYAAFHAARGLLYSEGHEPRTHQGTIDLFNRHFVKTGRFEPGTSRLLSSLQKFREQADYSQAFVIDVPGARQEVDAARGFVERVATLLPGPKE